MSTLKAAAGRVQKTLEDRGLTCDVREFPESTRTAEEAARAIGCEVGQIAKSLIFRLPETDEAVLVVASGVNRVDETKVARHLGHDITRADAAFVREKTGYSIGGVPPVGHSHPPRTLLDRDLQAYVEIWAAAGTSNAVFRLTPQELATLTGAEFTEICRA
ncbi:YbaK/EbsC family protein [Fodinicurvata halophila]|uniref:YbaK/EbsC family protein n=1 Tax=Fodinicurvata halophila TaxID=1419723 RepID=A0ABV8UPR9_9PROT